MQRPILNVHHFLLLLRQLQLLLIRIMTHVLLSLTERSRILCGPFLLKFLFNNRFHIASDLFRQQIPQRISYRILIRELTRQIIWVIVFSDEYLRLLALTHIHCNR